jgi:hypothetical protein
MIGLIVILLAVGFCCFAAIYLYMKYKFSRGRHNEGTPQTQQQQGGFFSNLFSHGSGSQTSQPPPPRNQGNYPNLY